MRKQLDMPTCYYAVIEENIGKNMMFINIISYNKYKELQKKYHAF